MPGKGTSNVARETPKKRRDTAEAKRALAGFRKKAWADLLIREHPMPKMVRELKAKRKAEAEERDFELQAMFQNLMERRKKKDVPSRFKLIIPPVH